MTKPIPLPSQAELRQLFSYDPAAGELRRRTGRAAGKVVGTKTYHRNGDAKAVVITLSKARWYLIHRIIWKWMTGNDPVITVDHANGNPFDNRWNNLRDATQREQMHNSRAHKNKFHPLKGAALYSRTGRYQAKIMVNGKHIHLGHFDDAQDAHDAYAAAAYKYFGQFARTK